MRADNRPQYDLADLAHAAFDGGGHHLRYKRGAWRNSAGFVQSPFGRDENRPNVGAAQLERLLHLERNPVAAPLAGRSGRSAGGGNLMSCAKSFLGLRWEHHDWHRRVSGFEIRRGVETNMWAREVERDFVRCDTEQVCANCGAVRRQVSCTCDFERGETCPALLECRTASGDTGPLLH